MIIIQSQEDLEELKHNAYPQTLKRFVYDLLEGLQAEAEPGEELGICSPTRSFCVNQGTAYCRCSTGIP
jgi:hypothetical protein